MDVTFSDKDNAFRDEVRAFFRDQLPQDIAGKHERGVPLEKDDFVRFQKLLFEHGWGGYNWPVEFGGTGWTAVQKYIFETEMAAAGAPGIIAFGLKMVGPVIYTFGNDEQRQRFLPDILEGNVWWCPAIITSLTAPRPGTPWVSTRTGYSYLRARTPMLRAARKALVSCSSI
jgi:alkylation response protein AidB-like acyl-CoA dehydrogenase